MRNSLSRSLPSFTFGVAACVATLVLSTGCPVAQVPNVPTDQNNDNTQAPSSGNNRRDQNRPIPPVPLDSDNDNTTTPDGGAVGGPTTPGGGGATTGQPISVAVTAPAGVDINILPGGEGFVTYEVFGGRPEDGAIAVELFVDQDGVAASGDENTRETGLAPRGQERFDTAGLAPGVYRIGVKASNRAESRVTYATGRLVIVGEATFTFSQPSTNVRVRPGTAVSFQATIESLAAAVTYTVFTDVDTIVNGNEDTAFTGGGLSANGTISTTGFDPGTYFIGLTAVDSAGQSKTEYFRGTNGAPRTITVDLAPVVSLSAPTGNQIVVPGTPVNVAGQAQDPEGNANVRIFRDIDAVFNNNEVIIAGPLAITSPASLSFIQAIDTNTLPAGTFRFGALVDDGVGAPVTAYAPGTIRINAAPTVVVTQPAADATVQSGAFVTITWNAADLEGRIQQIQILAAPDANNDQAPDGPPQIVGTVAVGQSSFLFDTTPFIGPMLVGVRITDDVNATAEDFAAGRVIVLNDAPTVTVELPEPLAALRPEAGNFLELRFVVGDRERGLVPQSANPPGIRVVVFKDEDNDQQPDSTEPVITQSRGFYRAGLIDDTMDSTVFLAPGILNAGGFGRFLIGVEARDQAGNVARELVPLLVDSVRPTIEILDPLATQTRDRIGTLSVTARTTDTSSTFMFALLDTNLAPLQSETNPNDPSEVLFPTINAVPGPGANQLDWTFTVDLATVPAGNYHIYFVTIDAIDLDVVEEIEFYYPQDAVQVPQDLIDVRVRDRLIGNFNVSSLDTPPAGQPPLGVVFRGFNFNDLAGSSMERVPDVNGDGIDESLFGSRFAKAALVDLSQSIGFGEGYLIYGQENRWGGVRSFNAVGRGNVPGLIFPGIRAALGRAVTDGFIGTEGISDITVIEDQDGDDLPELVFAFPRVESVSLQVEDPRVQEPSLFPDIPGMGRLEFNAWDDQNGVWTPNQAQFTRGGVVIVSSHNQIIQSTTQRNRKNDRALDLHEVGQLFSGMNPPSLVPYQRPLGNNCNPNETDTFANDGVTACGAAPDICPDENQPEFADPAEGQDPPPAGQGACCVPLMECQIMTAAACAAAGGIYSERSPCEGTNCGSEQTWEEWTIRWDLVFNNQGPGGFHMPWTDPPADPPLANPAQFPFAPAFMRPPAWFPDHARAGNECGVPPDCFWQSFWYDWTAVQGDQRFPCTNDQGQGFTESWYVSDPTYGDAAVWTGFYSNANGPEVSIREDSIGARILGQGLNEHFGTAVATDNIWLYISAPDKTVLQRDVPILAQAGGDRANAGAVHQLRVDARTFPGSTNKAQLWMERTFTDAQGNSGTLTWPQIDAEFPPDTQNQQPGQYTGRVDFTMPVPHQYIIETGGSLRGDDRIGGNNNQNPRTREYVIQGGGSPAFCPAAPTATGGDIASSCANYLPYPVDTAGYHTQLRPQQIVGPHAGARISYVHALEDLNSDGLPDFMVGSTQVRENFTDPANPTGATIGAVFIAYARPTGSEGGYLLERLALDANDIRRLDGIYIKGVNGAPIGRAFDTAGDFNGDGADDVIIGSEQGNGGTGEVIVLLGATAGTLRSPGGGWTFADAVAAGKALRFRGVGAGDLAGANVAGVGDVDGDGFDDVLISAPGATDPNNPARRPGVVYLIYGAATYEGGQSHNLGDVGRLDANTNVLLVPGVAFIGRLNNDAMGGGVLPTPPTLNPPGVPTPAPIGSRGVAALGDIDGDGLDDYAISAILGDLSDNPNERKTNAGEVYILYGKGDTAP